jgi:ankyrin repeat protein
MKNYINIFIIVASCSINFYAAEQATETPTTQATQLSTADQTKIKEYRNTYELFKQAVLTNKLGEAEVHLNTLKNQFSALSQPIRDTLFATMYDDTVTHLVGEHPSEEQFFLKAKKYIEDTKTGKETRLPQAAVQKSQPPTPPAFLTQQQNSAERQYTEDEKKKFDQEIADILRKTTENEGNILTWAIQNGNIPLAHYLIATQAALINKLNWYGESPLQCAITRKNNALVKHIIEQMPATVLQRSRFAGTTEFPLIIAITYPNIPIIKLIIANGADINAPDSYGTPPLFNALFAPEVTELLINERADLSIKNKQNKTLIETVLAIPQDEVLRLRYLHSLQRILESPRLQNNLQLKHDFLNQPGSSGLKPLCQAAEVRWKEAAQLLIKHGANCADEKYKDFLIPLIKEVEAERAKTTFDVLHGETLQEQKLPKPVANIVREYIEGEKTGAAQPAASKPSTTPATEVD